MARTSLAITASVDDKASGPLQSIAGAAGGLTTGLLSLDAATNLAAKAWGVLSAAGGAVIDFMVDAAKAAMEAEKAERDLLVSLKTHGANVDLLLPKLKAQANAIQQQTGISGDNVAALQAQLAALGVLPQNIEAATIASIGWSKTTGKDMTSAATDVVKVLNGKYAVLEKLGPKVRDTDEAIRRMSQGFASAQADGQTLQGQLTKLEENWGDLQEAIGGAVTESQAANQGVAVLSQTMVGLQSIFASPEGRKAVDSFFRALALGASWAIDAGLGALQMWDDVVAYVNSIGDSFEEAMPSLSALQKKMEEIGVTPVVKTAILNTLVPGSGSALQVWDSTLGKVIDKVDEKTDHLQKRLREEAQKTSDNLKLIWRGGTVEFPETKIPEAPRVTEQPGVTDGQRAQQEKAIDAALERARGAQAKLDQEAKSAREKQEREERAMQTRALAASEAFEDLKNRQRMENAAETERLFKAEEAREEREKKEARDKEEREMDQHAARVSAMFETMGASVFSSATSAFSQVGDVVNGELVTVGDAFANFLENIGKQILEFMAQRAVIWLFKLIADGFTGGIGGGVLSFLGFSGGGEVKKLASGGEVVGGIAGVDSVPAFLTPRETVLNVGISDAVRRAVPGADVQSAVAGLASGAFGARSITNIQQGAQVALTVNATTLERMDDARYERMIETDVASALQRLLDRGAINLRPAWES